MIIERLEYFVDPNNQFVLPNGSPNVAGIVRVYYAGTDDLAKTYCDFNGTRNPAEIRLDNNGRAIIIADATKTYRVEVCDSNGGLLWTVEPAYCIGGVGGGSGEDIYEIAMFDLSQAGNGLYNDIDANLGEGLLPIIAAGSQGAVRYYYYTARDSQAHTMTFTCGYDGIVELLVLHSDGTYEFTSFPGEVSVLKGNCDNHSVIPGNSGPTDFDCYEVKKEGDDIWIGSDKRVHANAGWYHVDMGVYVEPVDLEHFVDGRATIYVGAYVGHTPSANFDYKDYTSLEIDLSYSHETTPAVGFDIHVDNDGDIIHLSTGAPVGDYTAECLLDWFSIHRIKGAGSGGGGGGGGDTPPGDCNVHVIDLQFLTEQGAANLWQECVEALLDGKLLAMRLSQSYEGDNLGFTSFCEQAMLVPEGYTKESYIEYLRGMPLYAMLSFYARIDIVGGLLREFVKFTISPTEGLRCQWIGFVLGNDGVTLTGHDGKYGSNELFTVDYTDPDNPFTSSEFLSEAMRDIHSRGVPLRLSCRNSTGQFNIVGPLYLIEDGYFTISSDSIAAYYEDPDGIKSGDIPVQYKARLSWVSDPSFDEQSRGYYRIVSDIVYPLALDPNFNGPVSGGTP